MGGTGKRKVGIVICARSVWYPLGLIIPSNPTPLLFWRNNTYKVLVCYLYIYMWEKPYSPLALVVSVVPGTWEMALSHVDTGVFPGSKWCSWQRLHHRVMTPFPLVWVVMIIDGFCVCVCVLRSAAFRTVFTIVYVTRDCTCDFWNDQQRFITIVSFII